MALQAWKKLREETLVKKFGKEMRQVFFEDPRTGKEEEFYLFGQRDWSVILPVTSDGNVVAVRQYKQACDKVILELPAGTADFKDEDPAAVAQRELLSETGYKGELLALGSPQWIASRNSWTRFHCFLARACEKVQEARYDQLEDIETELIPLGQWIAMALNKIEEPSAIVATFRALPFLGYKL